MTEPVADPLSHAALTAALRPFLDATVPESSTVAIVGTDQGAIIGVAHRAPHGWNVSLDAGWARESGAFTEFALVKHF